MNDRIKRMILSDKEFEFQKKVNDGEIVLDFANEEHRKMRRGIDKKIGDLFVKKIEEEIYKLEEQKEMLEDEINTIDWDLRTKKELLDEIKKNKDN